MGNLLKVAAFSLLTIGFFAGFSNFGIPQISPAPPPKEEKVDLGAMTMDQFIALGERIYASRGTCTLCHNAVGGRAPLLEKAAAAAAGRMADPRYKGTAGSVEAYLYESMVKPSAYVVAGFGKAGSFDAESPMPNVSGGSIGLSEVEIKAVIAYLQDIGGVDVTVEIPTDAGEQAAQLQAADQPVASAAPAGMRTPEELIGQLTCGACHKVAGQAGAVGPDLTHIGAQRDKAYLRRAILEPNADVAEGFVANVMPANYGEQLYARELEALVDYLAGLR